MIPTALYLPDGTHVGIIMVKPEYADDFELYVLVKGEHVRASTKRIDPNKVGSPMH